MLANELGRGMDVHLLTPHEPNSQRQQNSDARRERSDSQGIAWWEAVRMGHGGWEASEKCQSCFSLGLGVKCISRFVPSLLTGYWTGRITMETLEQPLGEGGPQWVRWVSIPSPEQQTEICMNASAERPPSFELIIALCSLRTVADDAAHQVAAIWIRSWEGGRRRWSRLCICIWLSAPQWD